MGPHPHGAAPSGPLPGRRGRRGEDGAGMALEGGAGSCGAGAQCPGGIRGERRGDAALRAALEGMGATRGTH